MKKLVEIYERGYSRFLSIAKGRVRPGVDAEDVLAAALIRYLKAVTTGASIRNPEAYLVGCIHHAAADAIRRPHVRRERGIEHALDVPIELNLDLNLDVRAAIDLFEVPWERTAVWMFYAAGFTADEISEVFPVRSKWAWNLFFREIAGPRLKDFLNPYRE